MGADGGQMPESVLKLALTARTHTHTHTQARTHALMYTHTHTHRTRTHRLDCVGQFPTSFRSDLEFYVTSLLQHSSKYQRRRLLLWRRLLVFQDFPRLSESFLSCNWLRDDVAVSLRFAAAVFPGAQPGGEVAGKRVEPCGSF